MQNKNIYFSVIIPTYNRIEGLKNCLESLSKQTCQNFEAVVIDDNSPSIVSDHISASDYKFSLKIIRNPENKGPAGSRNTGILNSKYDWIAFLDDDDEWVPEKLEKVSDKIASEPETDFIYHSSRIKMINESTEYIPKREIPSDYFSGMLVKNIIGGTSMIIINRSLVNKAGFFDENLKALEDYELWLRFSKVFKPGFIDMPLTVYYYKTAVKSISKNIDNNIIALNIIRKKYESDYNNLSAKEIKENKEWEYSMLAHKCLLNYQKLSGSKFYFKAFLTNFRIKFLITSAIALISPKILFRMR
jgi:glycosyltransferase involved in cell wall biosynthesis